MRPSYRKYTHTRITGCQRFVGNPRVQSRPDPDTTHYYACLAVLERLRWQGECPYPHTPFPTHSHVVRF